MTDHTPIAQVPMRGIVRDLSNAAYHSISDAVSNSGLNDFAKSPSHYWNRHRNPDRPPRKVKAGQLEGTLAHCALFEPYEFSRRYAVGPSVNKATNVWKAFVAECAEASIEPISQDQHDTAHAQAAEARSLRTVHEGLATGFAEVSAFWVDPITGVRCRCRPDWVHPVETPAGDGCVIFDGKTFQDASPEAFARQVDRKAYDRQAALYTDGYEEATGIEVMGFVYIAMETEFPFKASVTMLKPEDLQAARTDYRDLLTRFKVCHDSDTWPGYGDDIELLNMRRRR